MGNKLYVGNLPFSATEEALTEKFAAFGSVTSAKVIKDRETGRSKGFGFVEMETDGDAQNAIQALNGSDMNGRNILVSEARPQEPRSGGGFGGGGGGGGRRSFGGGGGGGGGRSRAGGGRDHY